MLHEYMRARVRVVPFSLSIHPARGGVVGVRWLPAAINPRSMSIVSAEDRINLRLSLVKIYSSLTLQKQIQPYRHRYNERVKAIEVVLVLSGRFCPAHTKQIRRIIANAMVSML